MTRTATHTARIINPAAAGAVIRRPVEGETVLVQVFDRTGIWWKRWTFVSRVEHPNGMSTTVLGVPGSRRRETTRGAYNAHRTMPVLAF